MSRLRCKKPVGANVLTVWRVLADDAALALDLLPQQRHWLPDRCGRWARPSPRWWGSRFSRPPGVRRCPAHRPRPLTMMAPFFASAPPISAAAFRPYSVGLRLPTMPIAPGLVEPAGVAGAVEHQRHIRDAGKGQRVIRVIKRSGCAHRRASHRITSAWIAVPGPAAAARLKRGSIPGRLRGIPRFPALPTLPARRQRHPAPSRRG